MNFISLEKNQIEINRKFFILLSKNDIILWFGN